MAFFMTDLADGADLEVVRWRRFGHDRLYVNAPDGTRIGWLDLLTGVSTVELEEKRAEFERAIADHKPGEHEARVVEPTGPEPVPDVDPATEPEEPWIDLALNRPGEAVATEAKNAFTDAPVRNLAARVLGVHTDERAWRLGAKGESLVGKQVAKLGP